MNTFVGAEYVMANTLIALKRKGINFITFEKLRNMFSDSFIEENMLNDLKHFVENEFFNFCIFNEWFEGNDSNRLINEDKLNEFNEMINKKWSSETDKYRKRIRNIKIIYLIR